MSNPGAGGIGGFGIAIEKDAMIKTDGGTDWRIKVIAQLPDEGVHELNVNWVRSLFLTCISESDQTSAITNLIKGRLLFAGDIQTIPSSPPVIRFSMGLEVAKESGLKIGPGRYFVQVSARQFLSNLLVVECV